jgi:hypothetical protein
MTRLACLLAGALCAALTLVLPAAVTDAVAAPPIKGVALGLYHREADEKGYSFPEMIREIRETGADHVSLVVGWKQHDVRSTTLFPHPEVTIDDGRLRKLIREARARGLTVFLFPIIELEIRRPLEWRGTMAPRDVNAWWKAYERFILHYAKIAADEGVALLSIGSELGTTETWRDRWFALISKVQKTFKGKLVYSSNWDRFDKVSFWERLDFMGVTAYNDLTPDANASERELTDAWRRVRTKLVEFSRKIDRPLVITEVGYTSQDGAAVHPWDYTSRNAVDLEEQRRCYAAFVAAWEGEPSLAGVFWWNWFGPGGARDTYYTPRGKPAEAVLRKWYAPKP